MRDQRRKTWSGELPTGTRVKLHLPDVEISRRALNRVPESKADHLPAATEIAVQHQLRVCLKKIDDETVTPRELQYGGLDEYFTPREQQLLKDLFQKMTRPTEAEMARFRNEMRHRKRDGEWRWDSELLTGAPFDELRELEGDLEAAEVRRDRAEGDEVEELDDEIASIREEIEAVKKEATPVTGKLPGSKIVRRAKEQTPNGAAPALAAKEFQENLLRNCLDEIDGTDVEFADLRGTDLDEWLSPKEQHILITVLSDELQPTDDESRDFLESVQMG